jgi:rRNA maturation protein Rpf1
MKLIITSSREPSRRTRSFINELVDVIPHAIRFVRGKATLQDLKSYSERHGAYGILVVYEKKANPSALVYYIKSREGLAREILIRIKSVKLRREIPTSQKPLEVTRLILNLKTIKPGLPYKVADALARALKPEIIKVPEGWGESNAVELVVGGDNSEAHVMFICSSTGRICGPQFRAFKVVQYDEGKES